MTLNKIDEVLLRLEGIKRYIGPSNGHRCTQYLEGNCEGELIALVYKENYVTACRKHLEPVKSWGWKEL